MNPYIVALGASILLGCFMVWLFFGSHNKPKK